MKIITNFKDYYDHVAFKYGGGDPKIIYVRPFHLKIDPEVIKKYDEFKVLRHLVSLYQKHYKWQETYNNEFRGIFVGDKLFTQIKEVIRPKYPHHIIEEKYADWRLITKKDLLLEKENIYKRLRSKRWRLWGERDFKLSDFINFTDPELIKICKLVGTPVFYVNVFDRQKVSIDKECPNLGKDGIASHISPEDMYQHLSYFVGNKMKDSPDMMPPIKVDNDVKIVAAGFDLKTSFRKPKP